MNSIIKVSGLTKEFKSVKKLPGVKNSIKGIFHREIIVKKAVDDISFEIDEGEFVGFLGPNGAGKTTTLKMLVGILYPTSGKATVAGYVPWDRKDDFKKQIGIVMGQKNQLIWDLPAEDSLELFREIFEIPKTEYKKHLEELVELLDVSDCLNIQIRNLSLGQRMKMEIIAALLHRPRILFLDEPTLGLDVISQKKIRDFFKDYNKREKTTVILTSHYMEDVKAMCDRVMIINHGQLMYDNSLTSMMKEKGSAKIIKFEYSDANGKLLSDFGQVIKDENGFAHILVPQEESVAKTEAILREFQVQDISVEDPEADDIIREMFSKL